MAKKQITVSDINGEPIAPGNEARVVVLTGGKRYELDASKDEVEFLILNGKEAARRGRPPKAKS